MKKTFKLTALLCLMVMVVLMLASCDQLLNNFFMQESEQETTNPNSEKTTTPQKGPEQTTPNEVHTHTFGDWVTVKEPTKAEDGQKERSCPCGERETLSIPAIGSSGLEYRTFEDGTCTILGIGTCADVDIYIPSEIDGCKVTRVFGNAFRFRTDLKSVTIPDCVVEIGDSAFEGCTELEKITIGEGVTRIYKGMFEGCDKLIQKENGVSYVGNWIIDCDMSVNSVTLREGTIGIGDRTFRLCNSLKSITLPDSLLHIGNDAFPVFITNITIPESVISIDEGAFATCFKLVEIYNLSSVTVSAENVPNVLSIYTSADAQSKLWKDENGYVFYEDGEICYLMDYKGNDTELTLPGNCNGKNYAIHDMAFAHFFNITSVTIPEGVTDIGEEAFNFCTALKNVTIGKDVTSIGVRAFRFCGLTTITIPANVVSIGREAFASCKALERVELSKNITKIENGTFSNCAKLTEITIPVGVTSVEENAFYCCFSLKNITIPASAANFGFNAFEGVFDSAIVNFGGTKEQWKDIEKSGNGGDYSANWTIYCTNGDITKSQ